jgi:hypothetical protein
MSGSTTAAAASTRILGSAPEPFDGASNKAETFWTALENYYYVNHDIYSDENKCVAVALTHFKLGSTAAEWAKDRQKAALTLSPPDFGTWNELKDTFKTHFIPVDSKLLSTQSMHSLQMEN